MKPLVAVAGALTVAEFGPLSLERVRAHMISLGWSRKYINAQVARIRRAFKWGVSRQIIPPEKLYAVSSLEPLREGEGGAVELPPIAPVPWDAVERVLPFVSGEVSAMIQLQGLTGMRSNELTALKGVEIDRTDPTAWIYRPQKHKTSHKGKVKSIVFGPRAIAILKPRLCDGFLFTPAKTLASLGRRRSIRIAERYSTSSYQHAILHGFRKLAKSLGIELPRWKKGVKEDLQAMLEKAGIVYWHPHQIRHTRATETREKWGIEGAQAQTGNTLDAAQIYAEKSLKLAKKIAKKHG